jgi:hypothetical protein
MGTLQTSFFEEQQVRVLHKRHLEDELKERIQGTLMSFVFLVILYANGEKRKEPRS